MLVAAVAILEGYRWLNVLPPLGWRPTAVVFTAVAVPLTMAVTRGGRYEGEGDREGGECGKASEPGGPAGPRWAARAVTGAALLLVPVTVISLFLQRGAIAQLMGSTDLLFAVTALAAGLVNELTTDSGQRAAGAPSGGEGRPGREAIEPSRAEGRRGRLT